MTGLSDLNFGDFSEAPSQQPEPTAAAVVKNPPASRSEEVKEFFRGEENKRQKWDDSRVRLQQGIDQWIGVPQSGAQMGYMAPKKNHIKVLLCTLHTVLWQGNTW
jgi:hypothetical protein